MPSEKTGLTDKARIIKSLKVIEDGKVPGIVGKGNLAIKIIGYHQGMLFINNNFQFIDLHWDAKLKDVVPSFNKSLKPVKIAELIDLGYIEFLSVPKRDNNGDWYQLFQLTEKGRNTTY